MIDLNFNLGCNFADVYEGHEPWGFAALNKESPFDEESDELRSYLSLSPQITSQLDSFLHGLSQHAGRATLNAFRRECLSLAFRFADTFDPSKGNIEDFCRFAFQKAWTEYNSGKRRQRIRDEYQDQLWRENISKDAAKYYLRFEKIWTKKLSAYFTKRPGRWAIQGFSRDQAVEMLVAQILPAILDGALDKFEIKAGYPATYLFLSAERERILKESGAKYSRIRADNDLILPKNAEEILIQKEAQVLFSGTAERVRPFLSKNRQNYLDQILELIQKNPEEKITKTRIAELIGKDKSNAKRAFDDIADAIKKLDVDILEVLLEHS